MVYLCNLFSKHYYNEPPRSTARTPETSITVTIPRPPTPPPPTTTRRNITGGRAVSGDRRGRSRSRDSTQNSRASNQSSSIVITIAPDSSVKAEPTTSTNSNNAQPAAAVVQVNTAQTANNTDPFKQFEADKKPNVCEWNTIRYVLNFAAHCDQLCINC